MALSHLLPLLEAQEPFGATAEALKAGKSLSLEGLAGGAKPYMLAALLRKAGRPSLILTRSDEQAQALADDLSAFLDAPDGVVFLPSSASLFHESDRPDSILIRQRMAALGSLTDGSFVHVAAPLNAVLQCTLPPEAFKAARIAIKTGQPMPMDHFARRLAAAGYERVEMVEYPGQMARRGDIVDVFPSHQDSPLRIDFFGDEIERIRTFAVETQRTTGSVESALILPVREFLMEPERTQSALPPLRQLLKEQTAAFERKKDKNAAERLGRNVGGDLEALAERTLFHGAERYLPYLYPENATLFDYLAVNALIVFDEPLQVQHHFERFMEEVHDFVNARVGRGDALALDRSHHLSFDEAVRRAHEFPRLSFSLIQRQPEWLDVDDRVTYESAAMDKFGERFPALAGQSKIWTANGFTMAVITDRPQRMAELFGEHDVPVETLVHPLGEHVPNLVHLVKGRLSAGTKLNAFRMLLVTDAELFGRARLYRGKRRFREGLTLTSVMDLREGDHIVHINHGIGRYRGLKRIEAGGAEREYLWLEYGEGDRLFVPTDQIDRVQKYIGGDGENPTVHKLGGSEWARTKKRVQQSVREIARELVELYAAREALGGHAFRPDTPWQEEMEAAFPYEETPDQWQAIQDVKKDLERPRPMDRLICGDVGFGKTEIAIRAAFKAVNDGKQVAVLVPTTVLAQQHYNTFGERLDAYPVKVEMLSRFKSKPDQDKIVEGLKRGSVDIVIGTHRLLSRDIDFKDLGLIITDEEQRFGVTHKERLKQMRKVVDVLTLTATPIPRTLHMSLAGIRDMSVIEDPPEGRIPIQTHLTEYDDEIIREAILRELDRNGQVYFVHNRVESIAHIANHIQKLVPHARLVIGHGQMPEETLEQVMVDFYHYQHDILICTTIIESGLDIPNVNTIIVNDADRMGLAQLYQLRGRVGRSDKQAYCYLLYKPHKALTEAAEKRLEAVREFTDLGSGFKIAMRDLEIRGAGNLLGAEQHGFMASVGFDLYCQMISDAVKELRGQEVVEFDLPPVELPLDAHIPTDYIPVEAVRLDFYKKLSGVRDRESLKALQEEMEDRFGDPPQPVWNLLTIIELRQKALEAGVAGITHEQNKVILKLVKRLTGEQIRGVFRQFPRCRFQPEQVTCYLNPKDGLKLIEEVMSRLPRFKMPQTVGKV
ncbi:MAG: transcription-repair coupling factor [Armatimonadetes bacterium]|nr:transcription-repair coupling factor [Armatimonadota bacterium]